MHLLCCRVARFGLILGVAFFLAWPNTAAAGDKAAAKCVAVSGALLTPGPGQTWKAVKPGDSLADGAYLVALPEAELVSPNGAVGVLMLTDVGHRGPFPVLETAVVVRHNDKADLDMTLKR